MILLGYFSSGDDSEDEYIGSVGDKFWYYDNDGEVYSETDEEEDLNIGWEK